MTVSGCCSCLMGRNASLLIMFNPCSLLPPAYTAAKLYPFLHPPHASPIPSLLLAFHSSSLRTEHHALGKQMACPQRWGGFLGRQVHWNQMLVLNARSIHIDWLKNKKNSLARPHAHTHIEQNKQFPELQEQTSHCLLVLILLRLITPPCPLSTISEHTLPLLLDVSSLMQPLYTTLLLMPCKDPLLKGAFVSSFIKKII